ncbi:MAG TPA: triose-phosphate isomerase [Spirochaetota bacterium]|nr:triose-phosphate isomerase [Spirochaetota bacterium]HOD14063.1 triose-phosphate isomerase [Spirochaetota bacterium]HPG52273.1 triose-phosphate isomerase [Spirochaetota bacterium]HPN12655.1 triose-phosphate isomerase [Spirochaetota bacterium]
MARREIFSGNWKMYKTSKEAIDLVNGLLAGISGIGNREVVVFPPSPWAKAVADLCRGTKISVGMQNMHFEQEGAFTGEVSPLMVRDAGCRYVLIGHSERRHVFGETDEEVNRKVAAALKNGIEPMICVGELLDEREKGHTNDVLTRQVTKALAGVGADQMKTIVIAYEPVWAIGTGKVATPEIADEAHRHIRKVVEGLYGSAVAQALPVLYGGSVKPDNIAGLSAKENIDGVLVGGASLKADSFLDIIRVK